MDQPQNGASRSGSVPPQPHQEVSSSSNNHPYSRKDRSLSPRGYRRSSYSPRRRSPSPRSYRNGREDRYREDRYAREDRYDRGYGGRGGGYREERGYRDYPSYASERRGPPRRSKPIDRGSDKERRDSTTLYVGNLPYAFREQDVADMFERYGRLRKVTVQIDHYTGRNKGFAFVEFEDRRDAEDAFDKYNGTNVEGRRLKLDWDIGLNKKDQHRREKYGTPNDYGRSADPYGRGASPLGLRAFSPNYRTGGQRSPSPYRR